MQHFCSACGKLKGDRRAGPGGECHECSRGRPAEVPVDARCISCNESRPPCLGVIEVAGERAVACHNCAALAGQLNPEPRSLGDLQARLSRHAWSRQWREAYQAGVVIGDTVFPPLEQDCPIRELEE